MSSGAPSPGDADRGPAFSPDDYRAHLRCEIDALADLVGGSDLSAKVPWSRTWKLGDLVHHVGAIHRWAANIVEVDARRYLPIGATDDWSGEATSARAARWLGAGGARLLLAFERADPDRRVWAWGVDQHVRFWPRRMTHDA